MSQSSWAIISSLAATGLYLGLLAAGEEPVELAHPRRPLLDVGLLAQALRELVFVCVCVCVCVCARSRACV